MLLPRLSSRLAIIVVLGLGLLSFGSVGYVLIEGWPLWDALFMTAITLSTVGFGEVRPLSTGGEAFTIVLIVMGVVVIGLSANLLGEYVLSPERAERLRRRRRMRMIEKLQGHIIICGCGRVGRSAARTLHELKHDFVMIDSDPDAVATVREREWLVVDGDATHDETLQSAGIERAGGLLVCTGNDADNVFIVLSARALNDSLFIVARSVEAANEGKMRRVGADKVISPYQAGGRQMANIVLRPQVAEFMDVVSFGSNLELWLEQLRIGPNSLLAGKTVVEADVRRRTGAVLVALVRPEAQQTLMPDENTRLQEGDNVIVVGTREQLAALERMVAPQ